MVITMTEVVVVVYGSLKTEGIICENQDQQVHYTVFKESIEERIAKSKELKLFGMITQWGRLLLDQFEAAFAGKSTHFLFFTCFRL